MVEAQRNGLASWPATAAKSEKIRSWPLSKVVGTGWDQ